MKERGIEEEEKRNVPWRMNDWIKKNPKDIARAESERSQEWTEKINSEQMIKVKERKVLKPRPKKAENSGKPKGHAINSIDHHAPRGHIACSAATMH